MTRIFQENLSLAVIPCNTVLLAEVARDLTGMIAGKVGRRSITALLLSLALVVPLAAAQNRPEPEYQDHVVVVQFAPDVLVANKTGTTGLEEFDRRATRYGVYLIERVYPFLDHVEPMPKTRRNLMALRRTYYVRYQASASPEQVAGDLATAPGVVYAEPVLVNRTQASYIRATHRSRRSAIWRPD